MSWTTNARSAVEAVANRWRPRLQVSDEMRVRAVSTVLWLLVILGALGGATTWTRSTTQPPAAAPSAEGVSAKDGWAAAGFGARFVAAYLAAEQGDEERLASFFGDGPDVPVGGAGGDGYASDVSVAGLEHLGNGYWAVTVSARSSGGEEFWRVGVATRDGRLTVAALPTPVAAPTAGEPVELSPALSGIPATDDPAVQAVDGFVSAYTCGDGDLARYLAPGVEVDPVRPPMCSEAAVDRWSARQEDEGRQVVTAEVVLDPGSSPRRVAFPLVLARRGGRWEVAELLAAPAIADVSVDVRGLGQ